MEKLCVDWQMRQWRTVVLLNIFKTRPHGYILAMTILYVLKNPDASTNQKDCSNLDYYNLGCKVSVTK